MSVLIIFPGPADNKMTTQQAFKQEQRGAKFLEDLRTPSLLHNDRLIRETEKGADGEKKT